jgi:hypothetical protein
MRPFVRELQKFTPGNVTVYLFSELVVEEFSDQKKDNRKEKKNFGGNSKTE